MKQIFYGDYLTWLKFICWTFHKVDVGSAVRENAFLISGVVCLAGNLVLLINISRDLGCCYNWILIYLYVVTNTVIFLSSLMLWQHSTSYYLWPSYHAIIDSSTRQQLSNVYQDGNSILYISCNWHGLQLRTPTTTLVLLTILTLSYGKECTIFTATSFLVFLFFLESR